MSIYVLKGLVYRLSHDWHFDIDRDVSTAHCRSSSGDIVDLLSRTTGTTLVVSDWCITNHGWWVSIQSTDGIVRGGNWSIRGPLWWRSAVISCLTVGIHASGISIPPSLLMLLRWSLMWIASLTLRDYQCGSRSINLTSSQRRQCTVPLACSAFRNSLSIRRFWGKMGKMEAKKGESSSSPSPLPHLKSPLP